MDDDGPSRLLEVAHSAARGTIAAMAMTGARTVTHALGLLPESPPQAVVRRQFTGVRRATPPRTRTLIVQGAHWGYGAAGGAVFGALPEGVRRRAWAGPAYGVAMWLAFEVLIAPVVGIRRQGGVSGRVVLMADHLLYGLVLSEFGRRPRPRH